LAPPARDPTPVLLVTDEATAAAEVTLSDMSDVEFVVAGCLIVERRAVV